MSVRRSIFGDDDVTFVEVEGTGSGSASFFHTLTLTGLQALDAAGRPVSAQFVGASGTQYSENGVVPEPATLALTAFGIAGALARARRARQSANVS